MKHDPGASLPRARATFRRTINDGNYGNESVELTVEQDLLPGEEGDGEITGALLLELARRLVYAELGRSLNGSIRRTLDFEKRTAPAITDDNSAVIEGEDSVYGDPAEAPF